MYVGAGVEEEEEEEEEEGLYNVNVVGLSPSYLPLLPPAAGCCVCGGPGGAKKIMIVSKGRG